MKKKLLVSLVMSLMLVYSAFAQNHRITGKVKAHEDGFPLPGVSVKVSGTNVGTQSDTQGAFVINVPQGAKQLEFTYLGYLKKVVTIGNSTNINVEMEVDSKQLTEVVVTGYSVQEKREVGGSISKVGGKQFENSAIKSLDQALQGRVSGVAVMSSTGIPGGSINVQIRGVSTFTAGTQPLYIIDGVQINMQGSSGVTQSNPLAGINPNDIESIEVLKDAASSSIYGAQAANGVILVTTKKGKAGATKFNVNAYTGAVDYIKLLNATNTQEYYQMKYESIANSSPSFTPAAVKNGVLSGMSLPTTLTDAEIAALPTTDWQKEVTKTGIVRNYEVNASGGNEKTTFYISGAYNNSSTFVSKADFKRGVFRANLEHQATDKLSFDTRINLSTYGQKAPFAIDGSSFGNPIYSSSQILPSNPVRNPDGTYFGLPGSGQVFGGNLNHNVVAVNDFNSGSSRTNQMIGSIGGNYAFSKNLKFRSFYSLDYRLVQDYQYRDPRTNDGYARQGYASVLSEWRTNFLTNQTLNFTIPHLGDHKLNGFVGAEYRSDLREGISASGDGFPSPDFRNLQSAANAISNSSFFTGYKRAALFSALRYSYKGKYNLTGNLRYDGSSKFGKNQRYGVFGGVSGAWNISEEKFLKESSWVDELKLRASAGVVGNDDIGNFSSLGLFGGGGVYGGQPGIAPSALENRFLQWERKSTYEAGIDFSFFKGRLTGQLGAYRLLNENLLLDQPLLSTTGFSSITSNAGAIRVNGLEVELGTVNVRTQGGFEWASNFNISYFKSKIMKLYDGLDVLPGDPAIRVGAERGAIFTQIYAGVNPATGRPMWYDINNNLTYNPTSADRRFIGKTIPNVTGGFTNTLKFKGFDLSALLQYQYNRTQIDGQLQFFYRMGTANHNTSKELYDRRWTTPGQITDVPRPYNGGSEPQGQAHTLTSTRFYYKTDHIRLKDVQLGYNLPASVLSKLKISRARVYVQGQNLFTYADYPGYDPEYYGTATGIIPQSKNYTFGLLMGF